MKTVYIKDETHAKFKQLCKEKGLKMEFVVDALVNNVIKNSLSEFVPAPKSEEIKMED